MNNFEKFLGPDIVDETKEEIQNATKKELRNFRQKIITNLEKVPILKPLAKKLEEKFPEMSKDNNNEESIDTSLEIGDEKVKKIIEEELKAKGSPITYLDILNVLKQKDTFPNVKRERLMAMMKNDSSYGTAGKGKETKNPGNVGNTDDGSTKEFETREKGVEAVAENLQQRYEAFKKQYPNQEPTLKQLTSNQGPDGKGFYIANINKDNPTRVEGGTEKGPMGAYMSAIKGPEVVQKISDSLEQKMAA